MTHTELKNLISTVTGHMIMTYTHALIIEGLSAKEARAQLEPDLELLASQIESEMKHNCAQCKHYEGLEVYNER